MSGTPSSFLTKSIVLLSLVLIFMGGSMYLGKELGRNIMALTKSNIEGRLPGGDSAAGGEGEGLAIDLLGGRSSFGFNESTYTPDQFPHNWADPSESDLSVTSEEPAVEIAILDENGATEEGAEGSEAGVEGDSGEASDSQAGDETPTRKPIDFGLGDTTTFRIQVGTFSDRANAENLWKDLNKAGFDASISTFKDGDVTKYRVTVGTYHTREEADKVAEQIRTMGFDAWVQQLS